MTKYYYVVLAFLFFNCSTEKNTEDSNNEAFIFSYELDTVMVDAGDEFIYLNRLLTGSAISQDGNTLFNFDRADHALQIIDLENLVLERILSLELEGPNGIGSELISKMYETTDGHLVLSDNYQVSVLDNQGNKTSGFQYGNHDFEGEKLPEGKEIQSNETLSKDGKTLLALYGESKIDEYAEGVAVFDLQNKRFNYKPLDIFKELEEHITLLLIDDIPVSGTYKPIYLQLKGDSLIYSNSVNNRVYFLNLKTDSLTHRDYLSKYTSQEAKGRHSKRTESKEEFLEIGKEKSKEVDYGPLFFDDQNDVYWRFAKEMDRMKGDVVQYKTVLTAFNSEFNLLHEELLPPDFTISSKYFAREGMIYTFLNIDDELAFVRLKPTITYE